MVGQGLQVGETRASLYLDDKPFKDGLGKAEKSFRALGARMGQIGKTMSTMVSLPIAVAAASSFKAAADMQDAIGAADQIFKTSSKTMQAWADKLPTYYGIAKGEALEYSNMMGSMLQNIGGLSAEEAAKQSQKLVELAGDLTAMFGGETESAIQALTGSLKGNNTMLDNYGMAVTDSMVKTKAFEMGIYSGKGEMDLATKQAATLALIMKQSGAAQGQAAREAKGSSGSWRTLKTELKNLSTTIGDELLPIFTPIIQSVTKVVKAFSGLSPETKKLIVTIALIAAAAGPVLIVLGMMAGAITSLAGVVPILGGVLVPVFSVLKAVLSGALTGVLQFGKTLLTVGGLIMKGLGGALSWVARVAIPALITGFQVLAAAVGVSVGALVAIVAGIIVVGLLVWKNWDKIKAFLSRIWSDIASAWGPNIAALKRGVADLGKTLKDLAVNAYQWGANFIGNFAKGVTDRFKGLVDDVVKYKNALKALATGQDVMIDASHRDTGRSMGLNYKPNGYASGTNWHPGGLAWVGEQGPELVNLPRGSAVLSNHDSMAASNQSLTIGGTVRVEGVNSMNQLVGVAQVVAQEIERGDRRLAGRVRVMPSMA